jgi:hypothetical protein
VSKADFYSELLGEVENRVIDGETLDSAITLVVLQEVGIEGHILKHWVLKKHETEQDLNTWAQARREESDVARQAREVARTIYSANAEGLSSFTWWKVDWEAELEGMLSRISPSERIHEGVFRGEFMAEAARLQKGATVKRVSNAPNR